MSYTHMHSQAVVIYEETCPVCDLMAPVPSGEEEETDE